MFSTGDWNHSSVHLQTLQKKLHANLKASPAPCWPWNNGIPSQITCPSPLGGDQMCSSVEQMPKLWLNTGTEFTFWLLPMSQCLSTEKNISLQSKARTKTRGEKNNHSNLKTIEVWKSRTTFTITYTNIQLNKCEFKNI